MEEAVHFLTEARRRLAAAQHIEHARLLKLTISGLEKAFTGGFTTDDEGEAFLAIFFGGPWRGSWEKPWARVWERA